MTRRTERPVIRATIDLLTGSVRYDPWAVDDWDGERWILEARTRRLSSVRATAVQSNDVPVPQSRPVTFVSRTTASATLRSATDAAGRSEPSMRITAHTSSAKNGRTR